MRSYSSHSFPAIFPPSSRHSTSSAGYQMSGTLMTAPPSDGGWSASQAPSEAGGRSSMQAGPGPLRPSSFRSAGTLPQLTHYDSHGSAGTLILPLLPPEGDTHTTTFDTTAAPPLPPPEAGEDGVAVLDRPLLEHALDNMHARDELFMGKFEILGPLERRAGGQGIVQFARAHPYGEPVAIKFFLNRKAFDCEDALYNQQRLRGMMPAVTLIHSNDDVRGPAAVLHPCSIPRCDKPPPIEMLTGHQCPAATGCRARTHSPGLP